jgi:hypothetical protein
MKKLVVSAVLLTFAFFALAQLGSKVDCSASIPSLQNVESRIRTLQTEFAMARERKFDSEKMKEIFRFQSPSMSRFSIPYLTIMDIRLEASSLHRHLP